MVKYNKKYQRETKFDDKKENGPPLDKEKERNIIVSIETVYIKTI
jgi:hypothetical protein